MNTLNRTFMLAMLLLAPMLIASCASIQGSEATASTSGTPPANVEWISLLDSEDPEVRLAAVDVLWESGATDPAAVLALRDLALDQSNPEDLRAAALGALDSIGAAHVIATQEDASQLIPLLVDPSWYIRQGAVTLLAQQPALAAQAMTVRMRSVDWRMRSALLATWPALGEPGLVEARRVIAVRDIPADRQALATVAIALMQPEPSAVLSPGMTMSAEQAALIALGYFGPQAIPFLLPHLAGPEALANRAVTALSTIGEPAVAPLMVQLGTQRAVTPTLAALVRIGADAVPAMTPLLEANGHLPRQALTALGEIGGAAAPAVPAIVKLLDGTADPALREAAASALGKIAQTPMVAVPALITRLGDSGEDLAVRVAAAKALGAYGAASLPARNALIQIVSASEPITLRSAAIDALGRMGVTAAPAAPTLLEILENGPEELRSPAAQALGAIASQSPDVMTALATALENPSIRSEAAQALVRIGPAGVAQLLDSSIIPDLGSRQAVTSALSHAEMDLLLLAFSSEDSPQVRAAILDTFYAIGPRAIVGFELASRDPALRIDEEQLQKDFSSTVIKLVDGVPTVTAGFGVKEAIPFLVAAIEESSEVTTTLEAIGALGIIGPDAEVAVPVLAALLQGSADSQVRCAAAAALFHIGENAGAATATIISALRDSDPDAVCRFVREDREMIVVRGLAPQFWMMIRDAENHQDMVSFRRLLIGALRLIGPDAQDAIPALLEALQDPELRRPAAEALGAIGPAAALALVDIVAMPNEDTGSGPAHAISARYNDIRRSAAYALYLMGDLPPAVREDVLRVVHDEIDEPAVRRMLAVAAEAAGLDIGDFWTQTGQRNPTTTVCPNWPGMPFVSGGAYDVYQDECPYGPTEKAPLWRVWQYLTQKLGGR